MENVTSLIKTNLVSFVVNSLYLDLTNTKDIDKSNKVLNILIEAYNNWQEGEHYGTDYLFSLNDKEDLITCIQGGLTAKEIAQLYNDRKSFGLSQYFFFGENYPTPKQLDTYHISQVIMDNIEEIVKHTLAYGQSTPSTTEFDFIYQNYISPLFITNNE